VFITGETVGDNVNGLIIPAVGDHVNVDVGVLLNVIDQFNNVPISPPVSSLTINDQVPFTLHAFNNVNNCSGV
jgi:hypothetical protein